MYNVIDLNIFATRLSSLLNSSDETTYSLATKLSLSPATISRYANARMTPKVPTVISMAKIFNVNYAWLMGYDVPRINDESPNNEEENLNNELFKLFSSLNDSQKQEILVKMALMISENNQKES